MIGSRSECFASQRFVVAKTVFGWNWAGSVRTNRLEKFIRYSLDPNLLAIMKKRTVTRAKWIVCIVCALVVLLLAVYLIAFQSYEIIGESIECSTNAPFAFDYSCGIKQYPNDTQYWTFDWSIPDGIVINDLMVRRLMFSNWTSKFRS